MLVIKATQANKIRFSNCFTRGIVAGLLLLISTSCLAIDIQNLVDRISQANLENHVAALASAPRFSEIELAIAEAYITTELQAYGYTVGREELISTGTSIRNSANLVAELTGSSHPDEIFVIGAHFDTVEDSPGADDNAISVAAMLEIARVLANEPLPKTIRFIGFTFEESGYLGSDTHALNAFSTGENIIGMFSLEMIGYTCDEANCQVEFKDDPTCPLPVYPYGICVYTPPDCMQVRPPGIITGERIAATVNLPSSPLLHTMLRARRQYVSDLELFVGEVLGNGDCYPDTQRSDHWGFWKQNFPALMINDTGPFRNPHYHTTDDTPDTVDYAFATKVTKLALSTVLTFITPDDTLKFEGVSLPSFVDRSFGPDGEWLTADDYFVTGMNPNGSVSAYRLNDPVTLGVNATFGVYDNYAFYLKAPLQLGVNEIENDSADLFATNFEDENTQTLSTPPVLHTYQGTVENPPMKTQTITLNGDNTFTRSRLFRYRGTFDEFPVNQELGGYYLVRGQNPASVIPGAPNILQLFNTLIPNLPSDWQILFIDSFISADAIAPAFTFNNVAAFYSRDPNVVSSLVLPVVPKQVPFPNLFVALMAGCVSLIVAFAFASRAN